MLSCPGAEPLVPWAREGGPAALGRAAFKVYRLLLGDKHHLTVTSAMYLQRFTDVSVRRATLGRRVDRAAKAKAAQAKAHEAKAAGRAAASTGAGGVNLGAGRALNADTPPPNLPEGSLALPSAADQAMAGMLAEEAAEAAFHAGTVDRKRAKKGTRKKK